MRPGRFRAPGKSSGEERAASPQSRATAEPGPRDPQLVDPQVSSDSRLENHRVRGGELSRPCAGRERGSQVGGAASGACGVQLSRSCWPLENGRAHLYISTRSIKTQVVSQIQKASFMLGAGAGGGKVRRRKRWKSVGAALTGPRLGAALCRVLFSRAPIISPNLRQRRGPQGRRAAPCASPPPGALQSLARPTPATPRQPLAAATPGPAAPGHGRASP